VVERAHQDTVAVGLVDHFQHVHLLGTHPHVDVVDDEAPAGQPLVDVAALDLDGRLARPLDRPCAPATPTTR
jgi:hypothetical protein